MINLRNSPFLWFSLMLLIAFGLEKAIGIIACNKIQPILWMLCFIGAIGGLRKYNPGLQFKSTLAIGCLIMAAGMIRISEFRMEIFPGIPISESTRMSGIVLVKQVLKVKAESISLRCQCITLSSSSERSQKFSDKFLVVQIKEIDSVSLFPGDTIRVEGWLSALQPPLNPYAFDIRQYYTTLGIRHQMHCKGKDIYIINNTRSSIARTTAKWQAHLSSIVRNHVSPEVAQLTNALVWGDRSDMADEVRDAFADSGAMHVLSVSGMHVAIIYSMLYLILGAPGSGSFVRRMIRLGCYAVAILLYVGLTGACPAVVRAGLMILLFLVGKAMGWNTPIWNLLGFAGFVMLWLNPFIWMNIGFQLSFLAMAGILMYAQPMIRFLSFKYRIIHLTWEITAVSIAAQVFILPVLLKQFHQFPLTFIASSLVAMPASYVIIFGALLNVMLSLVGIHWLWHWFDLAGHYFILSMKWMAGLNPAMNFSLPLPGSILLMSMAIIFSIALIYKWSLGKNLAYIMGIAAFTSLAMHRSAQWKTNEMIIYHQYKGLLIDIISNGRCISIQDSSVTSQSVEFAARGNRCERDIIHTTILGKGDTYSSTGWHYVGQTLHINDTSIMIWNASTIPSQYEPSTIEYVLVDKCPEKKTLFDFACNNPDSIQLILPAHLDRFTRNAILKFCVSQNIEYYDIAQQGYFRLPL